MASKIKVTAEYENQYGNNQVETVIEIKMSKKNAAKFAKIIENGNELNGIIFITPSAVIDENTIEFANGWTGEDFDGIFCDEMDEVVEGYKWVR